MLQKNKAFMLASLLLIATPTVPQNAVSAWISQICVQASQWARTALNTAKEYNRATAALIGLGLCTALFTVLAKKQQNQWKEIEQKHQAKESELQRFKQEAQSITQKITSHKTAIKKERTDRENLEKELPLDAIDAKLKEENELLHNHNTQRERHAALQKEIATTQQQIQATQNGISLLNERNNPAHVHKHLEYWLKQDAERDEDDARPSSESKYGHEKGKYDK